MRRYRRTSVENWGWPPLFFNEKPFFLPISFKKTAGTFFLVLMQKNASPISETDFCRRKTKDFGFFFSGPKLQLSYTHIFASQKSLKIVTKSSLVETNQTFGSITSSCTCGSENCLTISSPFFPIKTLSLSFFQIPSAFYMERYRNQSFWISFWFHFLFLWYIDSVYQFLGSYGVHVYVMGPINWAIWCLTRWDPPAWNTSLKHEDSRFHHLQTLFVEGNLVRQLFLPLSSFD